MGRGGECRAGEIRRGEASLATSDSWHVFAFGFPSWFKNVYSYRLRQHRAWVVDLGFGGSPNLTVYALLNSLLHAHMTS